MKALQSWTVLALKKLYASLDKSSDVGSERKTTAARLVLAASSGVLLMVTNATSALSQK